MLQFAPVLPEQLVHVAQYAYTVVGPVNVIEYEPDEGLLDVDHPLKVLPDFAMLQELLFHDGSEHVVL